MKRKLSRISTVLGASGLLATGLATTAITANAATSPAWHTVLSVSNGTQGNQFDTVVATGQTSGWAFLHSGTSAYERTGASTWKQVPFPGTGGAVNAAAASSPSNVWAAYHAGGTSAVDRWNGRNWATVKSLPGQVDALSVLGPNDVWVFGNGVFHFNGRTWATVSATLTGGSALSDSNVWAFTGTDVEHYNGRTWTATNLVKLLPPQLAGHAPSSVADILALAPNNVYATGEGNQTPRGGPGVLLHYDGRTWTRVAEPVGFVSFPGEPLTSDGQGGLWIEAQSFPSRLPALFHYSAGQVTGVTTGAASISVSRIPGTTKALSGGFLGSSSVVLQSS